MSDKTQAARSPVPPSRRAAHSAERHDEGRRTHLGGHVFRIMAAIVGSDFVPARVRTRMLRTMGFQIARDTCIWGQCSLRSNRLRTAPRVFINIGFYHDGYEMLDIGRNVRIGPFVRVITASHPIGPSTQRAPMAVTGGPVHIKEGCWIGAGVIILPGVTIGEGCVIGAGSLVSRSTRANGLYMGVPARRVRDLDEAVPPEPEHRIAVGASSDPPQPGRSLAGQRHRRH
jgi:maltose O-acetyltransferase